MPCRIDHGHEFAPTGEIAAFCTAWYDDVTRTAYFEPVCAAPSNSARPGQSGDERGAAPAAADGMRVAFVGGYSVPANGVASAGFGEYDLSEPWIREW